MSLRVDWGHEAEMTGQILKGSAYRRPYNESDCVAALIGGKIVLLWQHQRSQKGHCLSSRAYHHSITVLSVCASAYVRVLSLVSLSVCHFFNLDNGPDHSAYLYLHGEVGFVVYPLSRSSIHYAFDEGLSGWTFSEAVKALRKKKKSKTKVKTLRQRREWSSFWVYKS